MEDCEIITLAEDNIDEEHICCAISDKKSANGVLLKKKLILDRLGEGFTFKKFNLRGKVFIEYVPIENAWAPLNGNGYMLIHCFWVAGQYKGKGLGRRLLEECEAASKDKNGIAVITGNKKLPFLNDRKYFIDKGFEVCDEAPPYFQLLVKKFKPDALNPSFKECCKKAKTDYKKDLTFVYSDLCPFTDLWVDRMTEFAAEKGVLSEKIKIVSKNEAIEAKSPFTVFSMYYKGNFVTHVILSEAQFNKQLEKLVLK
jgi:GNAT superfamily N-acetyltransferase